MALSTIRADVPSPRPIPAAAGLDASRVLLQGLYLELTAEFEEATAAAIGAGTFGAQPTGDEGDAGARAAAREQELAVLASIRERLLEVRHALARVDAGTYGRCERCGETIPAERLEARPAATDCVTCKRASERLD